MKNLSNFIRFVIDSMVDSVDYKSDDISYSYNIDFNDNLIFMYVKDSDVEHYSGVIDFSDIIIDYQNVINFESEFKRIFSLCMIEKFS